MAPHDFYLALAALLIIGALFVAVLAANDIDPCQPDCRVRFEGASR